MYNKQNHLSSYDIINIHLIPKCNVLSVSWSEADQNTQLPEHVSSKTVEIQGEMKTIYYNIS